MIVILGLGSSQASRIPRYDRQGRFTGYIEIEASVATTRLNAEPLHHIATATGGTYRQIQQHHTWHRFMTQHPATSGLLMHNEKPVFQMFILVGLLACGVQALATRL